MPVNENGVGHSGATIWKQNHLRKVFVQHLKTCQVIMNKHRWASSEYQYIDANSGSGKNECEDCAGSPVIFLEAANAIGIPYRAHFIDIEPCNTFELEINTARWNNHSIYTADNRQIMPDIVRGLPPNAYGLFYTDPNGVPDFDMIAQTSRNPKMQRVDILIRYSGSAVKRVQHNTGKRLLDYLATIKKKYWIVRELISSDSWQWTFLLGLNWKGLKPWRAQGFHYIHGRTGKEIIAKLHYTNDELKKVSQPTLPLYTTYDEYLRHPLYLLVRRQAILRSGGICEVCGEQPYNEVHHLEYPPWGTIEENADHLLAVCHDCHCKIHGKEN